MGNIWSQLAESMNSWFADDPARVILIGLDAAGKTTLVYKLKLNETVTTIPTAKQKKDKSFMCQRSKPYNSRYLYLFRFPIARQNINWIPKL